MGRTRSKLDGRDLEEGVGLAEFMLILLPAFTSGTALILRPMPELTTLLGLAAFFAGTAAGLGGRACSMMVTAAGLTNMPLPISHSKYRSPWTLPSFFPLSSSSSTPTQSPAAKWGCPMYRTVAKRPSVSSMTWPTWSCSVMMGAAHQRGILIDMSAGGYRVLSRWSWDVVELLIVSVAFCRERRRESFNVQVQIRWPEKTNYDDMKAAEPFTERVSFSM